MAENGNEKPNVLILGGAGFIGRNLVQYVVENDLANKLRVVDKVMPAMAWLNQRQKAAFSKAEFKHANLINPKSAANAFATADNTTFDFVINCAAETKLGQTEAVYRDGVYKLSCNCAQEASKQRARRYIELSTTQIGATDKKPQRESSPGSSSSSREPWGLLAKYKMEVERELRQTPGLDFVVVRPALVYGPGDKTGLTPRLVAGGIYKFLQEKMKLLWTKDLKINTVHVRDVSRAIWHLCYHGNSGEVYNLADLGNTTQGKIAEIISSIFNITHDYVGSLVSKMANLSIEDVIEDINDKHMTPWGEACQRDGINNTPLTPYIREEYLMNKNLYVDGTKIQETGFSYDAQELTEGLLREVLEDYVTMGLFPRSLATAT